MRGGIGVKCDSEKCKNACEKSPIHKPVDIFSSGKLQVIDQLLIFLKTRYVTNPGKRIVLLCFLEFVTRRKLKKTMHSFFFYIFRGHKVLMFSQMTRVLDIIQDYLGYRGN